jgi:poly(3-hydroxybutyrate) depolymerase
MRKKLLYAIVVLLGLSTVHSQNSCSTPRYTNPDFFDQDEIDLRKDVSYGAAIDWEGALDTQWVNLYQPRPDKDPLKKRPFIMLMHGGGFSPEDGFSNKGQWDKLCMLLARRGFVAATIDYRVGWLDRKKTWSEYTGEERKNPSGAYAIWRAYQDARAALRYFMHYASSFGIDTANIFVAGRSAGGDLSIELAYYSEHDVDSALRTGIPADYRKMFGGLDSSTNDLRNPYRIRALCNMWGPLFDTSMISRQEALSMPVIMFHGTDDRSVTYDHADTTNYPFVTYGSYSIAKRYKHLGGCYELHTKVGGGHGEDFFDDYLAEHMSAFFKSVMCGTCVSREYSSEVSLHWKLHKFFTSQFMGNFLPLLLVLFVITFLVVLIRRLRRRKRLRNASGQA